MFSYFFWFSQPSSFLTNDDKIFGYIFAGMFILGVVLSLTRMILIKDSINKKLALKLSRLTTWMGVCGLIWFGVRYENTPIFGQRYWAGIVCLIALVWLGFILKYLIFAFPQDKKFHYQENLKNKYLPASTRRRI